jgi:peptidyl-prolyl cis-trans isomerase SurA
VSIAMPHCLFLLYRCRQLLAVAALLLVALIGTSSSSTAQGVVAVVNGEPITAFDIEQRSKLIQVSLHKAPSRQEVLNELIDEKLKIQLLRRYNIDGIDLEVDGAFAGIARRAQQTPQQFAEQLTKANIGVNTLKQRIKAEIVWNQVIRGRFQSSFQITDKEILNKLETRNPEARATAGFDYTLRPIVFVVPRGSDQSVKEARRREAEALRGRFQNCESGISLARGLRDVAVRPGVVRSSADLAPALREILEKTEMGRLTPPETTQEGIQLYALCGKKPSIADNAPAKREVREEIVSAQFKAQSERYLKELRSQAMIEYR